MTNAPTTTQEQEEADFGRGPILWDADPAVCCAAFQLGACPHTEGGFDQWEDEAADEQAFRDAPPAPVATDDEPF